MSISRFSFDKQIGGLGGVLDKLHPRGAEVQMRVLFLLGLVVLSGCQMFRPIYYEGTC